MPVEQELVPDRIAIVEDESVVALDMKSRLTSFGYEVVGVFSSGEEALERLPDLKPSLVILDILLPGTLDGLQTAERLRSMVDVPVIFLTALSDEATVQRAKSAQPFAYIVKPFGDQELRTAIVIALYLHQMERRLREREQLFFTTLESIRDAVIVTDPEFRVEYLNPVARELLGLAPGSTAGSSLDRLAAFVDEQGQPVDASVTERELTLRLPDGRTRAVERTVSTLAVHRGEPPGYLMVLHDLTERYRQEATIRERDEQLRRAQKMEAIGRLTGGIAHDFNNLLTVIMGYARLLGEELAVHRDELGEGVASDLDGIERAVLRSAALTRQLLAFSRHQVMERRAVDVNLVVEEMRRMIDRLVSDDVQTQVHLADTEPVYVDPGQLEQVLLNLVVNARDAMPTGGRLEIRTSTRELGPEEVAGHRDVSPGRFVALSVRDTGVGMEPEVTERVFDPFFTTKQPGQGTGLGLSTAYGIVTQSGGLIQVNSRPGGGTTFTVLLPVYRPDAHVSAGEAAEPALDGLRGADGQRGVVGGSETVLLVDDDASIRALLSRVLGRHGYTVVAAASALEALTLVKEGMRPAILVADVVLPEFPGTELADRLAPTIPNVPVLYISAHPGRYLDHRGSSHLGHHYMAKPLDPAEFAQRIRLILDESAPVSL